MDKVLYKLYYTEFNFDGVDELYRKAKLRDNNITKSFVKEWLKKQATAQQTTKPKVGKQEYKPIYSDDMYAYQLDLTFLPKYKSANDGKYVLFTAVNVNSRYAYAYYSKNKNTNSIIRMLNNFLENAGVIHTITCDKGSEFISNEVEEWFKENKIKVFIVLDDSNKLGIINRFHRTLKDKLLKYFMANNTVRWIDVIDKIINNYNNSRNRGIGFTPTEASKGFIQSIIINKAIDKTKALEIKEDEINVGDKCRVLNKKKLFDKMQSRYNDKIYKIVKVKKNTVDIEDSEGNIYIAKKYNILIIKDVDYQIVNNVKKIVEKEDKIRRIIKKVGIEESNIVKEKRIPKRNSKYD